MVKRRVMKCRDSRWARWLVSRRNQVGQDSSKSAARYKVENSTDDHNFANSRWNVCRGRSAGREILLCSEGMTELPGPSFPFAPRRSHLLQLLCIMPQLPTPPTSRAGSEFPESKASTECLDDLLERYLGLLDQQQKLQAELAKQLSSVRSTPLGR